MRRRLVALGSLVVVVVAVVIVLTSSAGDEDDQGRASRRRPAPRPAARQAKQGRIRQRADRARSATRPRRPNWKPYTGPVPILEYHVLGHPPPKARPTPNCTSAAPTSKSRWTGSKNSGYEAVTLEQVQEAWYHGGTLPPKPIVLSFDDGYRPQFTFALPTLRKHGWAGVLNLKAEGSDLYESNVKAMIAAGWELAAHTIHHLDLTELGPEELEEEVAGSRKILQDEFKVPVDNFCYPAGQFDETVVEAVEARRLHRRHHRDLRLRRKGQALRTRAPRDPPRIPRRRASPKT